MTIEQVNQKITNAKDNLNTLTKDIYTLRQISKGTRDCEYYKKLILAVNSYEYWRNEFNSLVLKRELIYLS